MDRRTACPGYRCCVAGSMRQRSAGLGGRRRAELTNPDDYAAVCSAAQRGQSIPLLVPY